MGHFEVPPPQLSEHAPITHTSAFAVVHDFPHDPQFEGSREKSAHEPLHGEKPFWHVGPVSGIDVDPSGMFMTVSDEQPTSQPAAAPEPRQRRTNDNRNVFMRSLNRPQGGRSGVSIGAEGELIGLLDWG